MTGKRNLSTYQHLFIYVTMYDLVPALLPTPHNPATTSKPWHASPIQPTLPPHPPIPQPQPRGRGEAAGARSRMYIHIYTFTLSHIYDYSILYSLKNPINTAAPHMVSYKYTQSFLALAVACQSWKNMPMIAIMANLPLASSADNFLVFSSGSEEVNTLKP